MKQAKYKIISVMLFIFMISIPFFSTSIDAASRFILSNGKTASSIIYTNHSYKLHVKNQKAYFYSSKPSLVSVSKTTGKLLVKEPGSVTITARKRGTSKVICKMTFKVRRRSDYIVPSVKSMTFVTGETRKLSIRKSPSNSTDVIRFKSNNTKIATVNSTTGTITAVATGSTTIIAYSKSSAAVSNSSRNNRSVRVPVTVYSSVKAAKQIALNEVEVTFSQLPASLKTSNFSLTSSSGQNVSIGAVNSQGNTATLTIQKNLCDGKQYTLKYKSSSCKFTVSDGKVKKFKILTDKVPINTDTSVMAYSFDKNGIQLGEYEYGTTYPNITFTVTSSYLNTNKKLNFTLANGTATARIYYKETGSSSIAADSGNVVISAYDPEMLSAQYRCHITNALEYTFTDTSVCSLVVPKDSYGYRAYFNVITSSKKEIGDYSKYHVSSGNTNILIVQSDTLSSSQKYVELLPVQTGSTYLYLKDSYGVTAASFLVTVGSPSVLNNVKVSNSAISLDNTQLESKETITVIAVDQYENSLNDSTAGLFTVECISSPTQFVRPIDVNSNPGIYYSTDFPKLTFNGYGVAPGAYTYRIYVGLKYTTVTVVIAGSAPYAVTP